MCCQMKKLASQFNKVHSDRLNNFGCLETKVSQLQSNKDSQDSTIKILMSDNETLMKFKNDYSARLSSAVNELKIMKKNSENKDKKIAALVQKQCDFLGNIEFLERTVESLKNPRDHTWSSLKGELKVQKQNMCDLRRENNNFTDQCNSVKTSITQLRSRLNNDEKHLSEIKTQLSTVKNASFTREHYELLVAKINSVSEAARPSPIVASTRPTDNASNSSTNQRASPTHQDKPTQQAATLRALSQATTSTKTSSVSSSRYNVTTKRQQNEVKNDHASQTNRQNIPVIVQPRDTPPNRSMDRRIKTPRDINTNSSADRYA